jgi:hypothetical protein
MKKLAKNFFRAFSKEEVQMAKKHMKKMLTIPGHIGNANQNHINILTSVRTQTTTNGEFLFLPHFLWKDLSCQLNLFGLLL